MVRIFLSHNFNDKPFVRLLAQKLMEKGYFVWVDEAEISIGDSLIQKIADGLEESDYVIAVISTNSVKSNWVRKELQLAMHREIVGSKVHVLPVVIDRCNLPYFLRDKLYADFRIQAQFDNSFAQLLHAISNYEINSESSEAFFNTKKKMLPTKTYKKDLRHNIGKINVGTLIQMKQTADFRLAKDIKHSGRLAISYSIMATFFLLILLTIRAKWPSMFPSTGSHLLTSVILTSYIAAAIEFINSGIALIIIQTDKEFLLKIEKVEGNLLPFGKNWFALLKSSHHDLVRIAFIITRALCFILPILSFIIIYFL